MKSATSSLRLINNVKRFIAALFFITITFFANSNAQPCGGIPQQGNIIAFQNPVCPGAFFVLLLTNPPQQTGINLQWFSSANGINFNPMPGANQQQLQISESQPTYYRCIITCTFSGQSSFSNI